MESKIKAEDTINKAFLKVIEIALKTNLNDEEVPQGELAQGLKQVIKEKWYDDNYDPVPFTPLDRISYESMINNNQDNLISYLKSRDEPA